MDDQVNHKTFETRSETTDRTLFREPLLRSHDRTTLAFWLIAAFSLLFLATRRDENPCEYDHAEPRSYVFRLDPNTASLEELVLLPGIGKKLAENIVEQRVREPFASVDDLRRVRGIGVKRLEALRPYFERSVASPDDRFP